MSSTVWNILYKDFTEDDVKRIQEEKDRVEGWSSEDQFVKFIFWYIGKKRV